LEVPNAPNFFAHFGGMRFRKTAATNTSMRRLQALAVKSVTQTSVTRSSEDF